MALEWKSVFTIVGIIFLLFFAIPIQINEGPPKDEVDKFESYLSKYNRTYGASEFQEKFRNFQEVLKRIDELNANRTSNESALYGLTRFSDLSPSQFREKYLVENNHMHHRPSRKHHSEHENSSKERKISKRAATALPLKVDWREKGIIGDIRDQHLCGACWAFSTVENVESMTALKTGTLPTLSVQELIDCARNGNMGCRGGDPCNLLDWLVNNNISIVPEKNYPLKWATNACSLKGPTDGIRVADYSCKNLVGQEEAIQKMLANHGPVAVAVNALTWQFYTGGVIQFHCDGGPLNLNHVVQLVGYDRTASIPHYIARNSWGTTFGDKGYAYIAMGKNMCGLGTEVSSLDVTMPINNLLMKSIGSPGEGNDNYL